MGRKKCLQLCASLFVSLAMFSQANGALVDGLENYWDFDGNLTDKAHGLAGSASTVADNGVFAGANGTDGIAYDTGLFGQSIKQNGAGGGAAAQENDGHVEIPRSADTLHGGRSLTTSMWVQVDGFDTSWQTALAHGEGNQYRIARRGGSNVSSYAGGAGDIPGNDTTGPNINDGGWHHIVAVSNHGVDTQLWVDGSLVATGNPANINDTGNNNPTLSNLLIGANPQTGANNREWWGEIDDVAMWDRALSSAEIIQIHSDGLQGLSIGRLTAAPAIPEPATAALGLLGVAALVRRRRRTA